MEKIPFPLAGTELYRPLNSVLQQIRLPTILPGNFDHEVQCIMNIASLHHDLVRFHPYETISYVWGNSELRSSIRVNGETVNVPQSSMAALRRMRLTDLERVVWIDAICINQCDNCEKSTQVALMAEIYKRGHHNLIFLGDDEDGVAEEVQSVLESEVFVVQWTTCYTEALGERRRGGNPKLGMGEIPNSLMGLVAVLDSCRPLLDKLYNLPYFQRLWIFQEAVLSVDATCVWGEAKVDLDFVLVAAKIFYSRPEGFCVDGLIAAAMMWTERTILMFGNTLPSFMDSAKIGALFEVTDPRDRVFAHISCFRESALKAAMSPLITPDYSKTTQQVYRDATRFALQSSNSNYDDVWKFMENHSQTELEGRTTWAIQFGRYNPEATRSVPKILDYDDFRAGIKNENNARDEMFPGKLTILRDHIADPNILTLYVAVVGSVLETTTVLNRGLDFAEVSNIVRSVHAMTTFEHEATALVLAAGALGVSKGTCFRDVPHLLEGYHAFMRYFPFDRFPTENEEHAIEDWWLYWLVFIRAAINRRFCKTASGLVGCGSQLMRAGDVIVVPENGWCPLVPRPVEKQYLYIGVAYVHGIMHGEVFDMDVEWKWVEIR